MFAIVRRRLRVAFAEAKLHEGQSQACSQHRNQHLHVAHLAAKHSAVENKAGRRAAEGHFENEACAGYQAECKESWNAPIIGGDIFTAEVNLLGNSRGMSVMGQLPTSLRTVESVRFVPGTDLGFSQRGAAAHTSCFRCIKALRRPSTCELATLRLLKSPPLLQLRLQVRALTARYIAKPLHQ
jgi:hypothetical protein